MTPGEPRLRAEDHRLWAMWRRTAALHARTPAFRRTVDGARRQVEAALQVAPRSALMVSGGKDSSLLWHLVRVLCAADLPVLSEKDDLDFPGEAEHVEALAREWGSHLTILRPPISPRQWILEHAAELSAGGDFHSRAAGLSKACFYDVVETANAGFDGIFLGLRAEESRARRIDRAVNQATVDGERVVGLYQRRAGRNAGQWRATPIGDFRGLDVLAYAEHYGVPLLHVYRCIALMHAREPWRVRKSWWVQGEASAMGGTAWLGHYYPGLFAQLRSWLPDAQGLR